MYNARCYTGLVEKRYLILNNTTLITREKLHTLSVALQSPMKLTERLKKISSNLLLQE